MPKTTLMQALSSYNPDRHSVIGPALRTIENSEQGFTVESHFSERGVFAQFVWPDWPEPLSREIARVLSNSTMTTGSFGSSRKDPRIAHGLGHGSVSAERQRGVSLGTTANQADLGHPP